MTTFGVCCCWAGASDRTRPVGLYCSASSAAAAASSSEPFLGILGR